MRDTPQTSDKRRDEAARAAWLYFVAGRTQDEIASQLDVSRQAAQRLVALAISEKLIKFRLDHPIAAGMEMGARLAGLYGLDFCDVALSDPRTPGSVAGVAMAVSVRLERLLSAKAPTVIFAGTGRTMRAAVEELEQMDRPQHKIGSLVGSMAADGHASPYDVTMRLADKIGAQRFPMLAPVLTETLKDRKTLQALRAFEMLAELRQQARASFVGVSEIAWNAPIHRDGFMTDADISALIEQGAVGEITGWSFDADGRILNGSVSDRVASLPLEHPPRRMTVIAGCGMSKVRPLKAALKGGLATALVTDEATAEALLSD